MVRKLPRIESYYNDALQIPFVIYVPNKFIKNKPQMFKILKDNQKILSSNLDVAPTIIRFMGHNLDKSQYIYKGADLTKKHKEPKIVFSTNSNEVKKRINVGFGVYTKNQRLVASTIEGIKLFQYDDNNQKNDIWNQKNSNEQSELLKPIKEYPILLNIFNQIKEIKIEN